jgi:hypothetical protein
MIYDAPKLHFSLQEQEMLGLFHNFGFLDNFDSLSFFEFRNCLVDITPSACSQ